MQSCLVRKSLLVIALLVTGSCATYYQSNVSFNEEFEKGDLRKALKTLRERPSDGAGKKQFLYFVNNGLILSLLETRYDRLAFFRVLSDPFHCSWQH